MALAGVVVAAQAASIRIRRLLTRGAPDYFANDRDRAAVAGIGLRQDVHDGIRRAIGRGCGLGLLAGGEELRLGHHSPVAPRDARPRAVGTFQRFVARLGRLAVEPSCHVDSRSPFGRRPSRWRRRAVTMSSLSRRCWSHSSDGRHPHSWEEVPNARSRQLGRVTSARPCV